MIPAHNEERLLPKLLASVQQLKYPAHRFRTVVIADNCTDKTVLMAKTAGVFCLERHTQRPSDKAQALRFAIEQLPVQAPFPAAVVCIIDADCVLDADYLLELDKMYSQPGAPPVVQSYRSVGNTFDSDVTVLDAAAEALRQWVQLGTRKWLGQNAFLFGLGCSMRATVFAELAALPLASLAEDKEWKVYLTAKNVRVGYCPTARLSYEVVTDAKAFRKQRNRWLAGYYRSLKTHGISMLLRGVKAGSPAQLDLAGDLLQPPRSILLLAAVVLGLLAFGFDQFALVSGWVWVGIIGAFGLYGALGLRLIRAQPRYYLLLFSCFKLMGAVVKSTIAIMLGRGVEAWDATRPESRKT
nr:glycosyltransferase family 2 protein [Hymenobacter terricola]